jgi:hypothetical protein
MANLTDPLARQLWSRMLEFDLTSLRSDTALALRHILEALWDQRDNQALSADLSQVVDVTQQVWLVQEALEGQQQDQITAFDQFASQGLVRKWGQIKETFTCAFQPWIQNIESQAHRESGRPVATALNDVTRLSEEFWALRHSILTHC